MPVLQLGTQQAIVYYHNIDNQTVLNMFDVQRQATVPILGKNEQIQSAQVSADGQWILIVANMANISELQLVRVDGKFFQVLYCAPAGQQINAVQWSLNQKQMIFSQESNAGSPALYLLQLVGGSVPLVVSADPADASITSITPVTWLDNTRVYVTTGGSHLLYLLDTSKGLNQQISDMKLVRGVGDAFWDFDTSIDARTLYMSILFQLPGTGGAFQAEIDANAIDGSGSKQIVFSHDLAINGLRVVNSSTIVFVCYTQSVPQGSSSNPGANNGFWKMQTDGSGLVHLNGDPNETSADGSWGPFNPSSQYTWSNFSRNGAFYTDGLSYGSLSGGPLTRYASVGEGDGNVLVGWTTI